MPRCDVCGKFRKRVELSGMGDDHDEWNECIYCMSGIDLERHNANLAYWDSLVVKDKEEQNEQAK